MTKILAPPQFNKVDSPPSRPPSPHPQEQVPGSALAEIDLLNSAPAFVERERDVSSGDLPNEEVKDSAEVHISIYTLAYANVTPSP